MVFQKGVHAFKHVKYAQTLLSSQRLLLAIVELHSDIFIALKSASQDRQLLAVSCQPIAAVIVANF